MSRTYELISSDSHLEVKPERWRHRVTARYRDSAPRTVTLPDGGDAFVVDGAEPAPIVPADNRSGRKEGEWRPYGLRTDDAAGAGPPEQRLAEMEEDGLDAEVLFPGNQRGYILWRGIRDDAAYAAVVRGYNDWLALDYCSCAPERLIGLGVIPSTNLDDALEELQHCADLGLKGVLLGSLPSRRSYPCPEDDLFWQACLDLGMAVTVHVQFQPALGTTGPTLRYPREDPEIMKKLHRGLVENMVQFGLRTSTSVVQLVLSGLFDRFPDLEVFFAETRLGWVPFWLEQADLWYGKNLPWAKDLLGFEPLKMLPSEYVRDHILWSVQYERFAVANRDWVGVDHIMFASDFPHIESEWPNSRPILDEIYAAVPPPERQQIFAGNAERFFHLT